MPANKSKCCPFVKHNFRTHYTCHKTRASLQKYGSYLNRYFENESPFVNQQKYTICYHLAHQLSIKVPFKEPQIKKEISPSIPTTRL